MSDVTNKAMLGADEVLKIDHLSISFGGLKAVSDFSAVVKEKEIFGIIGPNGAGKTTLFNCITQFYHPDEGEVIFRTKQGEVVNLVGEKVHNIIRKGLVRTFQNVEVVKEISIIDNVLVGAHIDFKCSGLAHVLRLPKARREEEEQRKKAGEILKKLGIYELRDQMAGGQPYGVLKKVEMARALMCEPKIVILDEPAAGLDDKETEMLAETIRDVREQFDCTILLIEHDMGLVMSICDRLCAISFGKLLACGTPKEIRKNKDVQEAYLGEEE